MANIDLIECSGLKEYIAIPNKEKVKEQVSTRFDEYIKSLRPEILDNKLIDIEEIIEDYFEYNAPFENSEKKRKEFPDAFIANQIRIGLPQSNAVIISSDNGFKNACKKVRDYILFDSLGELYNAISKQDMDYDLTYSVLKELDESINIAIKESVEENECITVLGQSYDRKGVVSGHDYEETVLNKIEDVLHCVHIIDDIKDKKAVITLKCFAYIEMSCYYKDYENTIWDSESKEYVYIETVNVIEKHNAKFAVKLFLNL